VSDAFVGRVGKFHSVKCFSGEAAGVLSGDGSRASRKSGERLRQGSNGPHHHAPVHRVGSRAAALQGVLVAFQASKVSGSPASRFRAETSSQPFSRIQRSSTALVEATNETACQPPLAFEARRYKIHCRLSAPSAQSPETANCRSRFVMSALMPRPRDLGERGANSPGEIPGLSAPIPGVLFAFLPFLRNPVRRRQPLFHRHFRVLAAGLEI